MASEELNSFSAGRLKAKAPPMVPVEMLVAVGEVTLAAGDVPRGVLREFYEKFLGLVFVAGEVEDGGVRFRHQQQRIHLDRGREELGRVGLLIRQFDAALQRLRGRGVRYELLHTDNGLTRTAILRDPAGNWVHLLETRGL
ncbi:MAG: VOC family protein [Phycisphaerae bacterium]